MKKYELPNLLNDELLEELYGFCYARAKDSYEAKELCSDITFALVKTATGEGEIAHPYAFIWQTARNVYADFSFKRAQKAEFCYQGDAEELLLTLPVNEEEDNTEERLQMIYQRIAFLTKAYREVMISFYLNGKSTAEIAKMQNVSEVAVRQRLFAARKKIKDEVENMNQTIKKPVALDDIDYAIIGTGSPGWGDPREGFIRQFSKHIVWLCRKKPKSAAEIANELNVPTKYVEEELEILVRGENGKYGLLRKTENGKYAINFILFEENVFLEAIKLYQDCLPKLGDVMVKFIEEHREEYLSYPYLNHRVDMNLIMWQQVFSMAQSFSRTVEKYLNKDHFADVKEYDRPFSVFGYVYNGMDFGCGCDGVNAQNVCGYSKIHLENIYITRIKKHFHCGLDVANDKEIQLALRAIKGLDVHSLNENEQEIAAKAIECGYLYRENDTLYTKILVSELKDDGLNGLFDISDRLKTGHYWDSEAKEIAEKLADLLKKNIPEYLIGEWRLAERLASLPIFDGIVEILIDKGILTPPENGVGAEGCWMCVE